MKLDFVRCTEADVHLLARLGRQTYYDTFAALNRPQVMSAYLDDAFSPAQLLNELRNPHSVFLLLYADHRLAGYLKTNEHDAQTDLREPDGLELERIYVKQEFQGQGLGRALMERASRMAADLGKAYLWLGVWQRNTKAIAFYESMGFRVTGTHTFLMADEEQTDFVMRRD